MVGLHSHLLILVRLLIVVEYVTFKYGVLYTVIIELSKSVYIFPYYILYLDTQNKINQSWRKVPYYRQAHVVKVHIQRPI